MTIFMLDTNICSFIIRGRSPTAEKRLVQLAPRHEVVISAIAHFELRKGGADQSLRQAEQGHIDVCRAPGRRAAVGPGGGGRGGPHHATLGTKGRLISLNDTMIAGHALATDSVLVTNNTHEFKRVKGLKIEDWA